MSRKWFPLSDYTPLHIKNIAWLDFEIASLEPAEKISNGILCTIVYNGSLYSLFISHQTDFSCCLHDYRIDMTV